MGVVGFRERDADQITNKWDGLIKEYKKLKEYLEGTGSANWWGMSREQKKDLSKSRRMPLEFSESMYMEMEGFVGKHQIFGRATNVLDSDRIPQPAPRQFARSPSAPCSAGNVGAGSAATSSATLSESLGARTPGDDTPGSTGRKRKATGSESLTDFVRDFNSDYIARVDAQDKDRRAWRSEVFAFDTAREARLAFKEAPMGPILNGVMHQLKSGYPWSATMYGGNGRHAGHDIRSSWKPGITPSSTFRYNSVDLK